MGAELVASFLAALPGDERGATAADPALAERLDAMLREARAAWPAIDVPADAFVAHVAARLPSDASAALAAGPRAADLFLACACARGDTAAVDAFQQRYFGEIDLAGRRARCGDDIAAEARQNIARVLFTGSSPAIAGYTGRGDLRGWIRIIAIREVVRLFDAAHREVALGDDAIFDELAPADDPELGFLKDRYRDDFAEAFRAAVAALSERERGLLRRQLAEGWGIDDVAAHHGVHRSTAARWLAAARQTLLDHTRERLKTCWGATTLEVDSVVRLLTSRLDLSLERMLAG